MRRHLIIRKNTRNTNEEGGAYKDAIGLLYRVAFTVKMSKKAAVQSNESISYGKWRTVIQHSVKKLP